jgi:hypothetical protein
LAYQLDSESKELENMGNDGSSEYEDKNILINAQIDPEKLTK